MTRAGSSTSRSKRKPKVRRKHRRPMANKVCVEGKTNISKTRENIEDEVAALSLLDKTDLIHYKVIASLGGETVFSQTQGARDPYAYVGGAVLEYIPGTLFYHRVDNPIPSKLDDGGLDDDDDDYFWEGSDDDVDEPNKATVETINP